MDTTNTKPNYKIFHFDKQRDKIVDERFHAENDEQAYAHLLSFRESHHEDGVEYFYQNILYTSIIDFPTMPEYDIEDHRFYTQWKKANQVLSKWDVFVEKVDDFLYCIADTFSNIKWKVRDFIYLMRHKEAYSNQWNLDWHLIDSIELNLPSLIKHSHAMCFLDEAVKELHKDDPNFDIYKYYAECQGNYSKEVESLAMKIQNEEYGKLLLYVKLYKYYANGGNIDYDDPEQVEFDKKWRHTLPIKPGTYDRFSDYKLLDKMTREQWENIWDWVKQHGQKLCD